MAACTLLPFISSKSIDDSLMPIMTTTALLQRSAAQEPHNGIICHSTSNFADFSRGATELGFRRQRVLLETDLLDNYAEPDGGLGLNTGGVILRVLAQHVAACPGGGGDDSIGVCLHRREDGHRVEVQLAVKRSRRQGQECLLLSWIGERPTD
jgi:hypothetical protein